MAEEEEDWMVFAVVSLSTVSKNHIHFAGSFVHETYSVARKFTARKGSWADGKAVPSLKVISRRIMRSDVLNTNGQRQIIRNITGWQDISVDDHHVYDVEDTLGGRKGLA